MFENIIGQANTIDTLRRELTDGTFPAAVLLQGPAYAGKLSTALEIARVLTCQQTADWSCPCSSCRRQRLLVHPNTLLAGSRYFDLEITAAADVLRRVRKAPSQYLFIRAVRKLTRRFDPLLWEADEAKIKPLEPAIAQIEDSLDGLSPGREGAGVLNGQKLDRQLESLVDLSRHLSRALPSDNIPINHIRRATAWLHLSAAVGAASGEGSSRKILILENADRMLEPSVNSLLKLLEEPPADTYLILITVRRAAMIPTVLSRLRPYAFPERRPEQSAEILSRIFHEDGRDYPSLRDYFLYWQEVNPGQLKLLAHRFVQAVLSSEGGEDVLEEAGALFERKAGRERDTSRDIIRSFFEELTIRFELLLREGKVSPLRLKRWNLAVRQHLEAFARYNQQAALTLESLFYSLRGRQ